MKYIIDGENNYQLALVPDILERRGVKDVNKLLNLDKNVLEPVRHYENLDAGRDLLFKHLEKGGKIHLLIDTDVDGLTSSGFMYLYIKDLCDKYGFEPEVTYHINEGKKHGIDKNDTKLKPKKIDLLIVPDAGSSDKEGVEWLIENGVEVLVIDHHNLEEENILGTEAVLINPQTSPRVENKNISGVGVVYKFCKYLDELGGTQFADEYLDLVALGNIADLIDMREPETKFLVDKGLANVKNEFIKELISKNEYMMGGHMTPTTIGWNISPSLNATIRVGKPKERLDMFEALIGVQKEIPYKTAKKDEVHSLQMTMARVCGNVKGRQDRAVKASLKVIQDKIESEGLDRNQVLMVNVTGILDKSYTGLVANKLASAYKKPIILLQERKVELKEGEEDRGVIFGGSGRNYDKHPIKDLQVYLLSTGFFDMVAGHDNAFGVEIQASRVQGFFEHSNKELADVKVEKLFIVDYEIPMHELTSRMIKEVAEARGVWGKGVHVPIFAITNIRVNSKDVELHGTRGKTIRFKKNDISFNLKYANEEKFDKFRMKAKQGINVNKDLNYTIIGKFDIQESNGRQFLQVDIIDYSVKKEDLIVF